MARLLALLYGVASYAIFFATFLYLVGFVGDAVVPKTVDAPPAATGFGTSLAINLALIALFGIQHSVMARPAFKKRWTRVVPGAIERSTYVLLSSVVLILMMWLWQPLPAVVWDIEAGWGRGLLWTVFLAGVSLVFLSTFNIDHFDLFGLRQVWTNLRGAAYTHPGFRVTYFYRFVRHPLLLGFLLFFWGTPTMTAGHLLLALGMTVYTLIAIPYEERDLVRHLGDDYENYRRKVPKLIPRPGSTHAPVRNMGRDASRRS